MNLSFDWLIDPILPDDFFANFYEKQPLLVERQDPGKWDCLLSIADIDHYLATQTPRHPDVFLVDAVREISPDDYALQDSVPSGKIDLPRAYQLFETGATISLSQMHERVAPLAHLCRAMESSFSSHFQTNIYLSPPGAQGFKTHYDSHDVFVLQVSGSKVWTIYDTAIELPLRGQAFDPDKHTPGPPTHEFTLNAGDLLYCPRGVFHSARSTEEKSLHITLGQIAKTWADLLIEAVSEVCLATPALRASLPVGFARPDYNTGEANAKFRELLDIVVREADAEPVLQRLAEEFVTSRRPDLSGSLQQLDSPLSADSRVAARPNLTYLLREDDQNIIILFGASEISFPIFLRNALDFALSGNTFSVNDLPDLDDDAKLVLVRRLLKEGLLKRQGHS